MLSKKKQQWTGSNGLSERNLTLRGKHIVFHLLNQKSFYGTNCYHKIIINIYLKHLP